ncbi:FAD-binding oxidoreductase [Larkinella terrae]|uniref:Flavodoxin reductase n=1 Tax=Larkinella terrae TaxID=2025311 RepID=A0A7K0ETM8_9BACT|nr:FAD-binding oxidoreductase [Larkinella terrae]MRS64881.1 flavodoxin reductase [Larkinella terrae]
MDYLAPVLSITPVTHNVHCIRLQKPENYAFIPGQATDVSINKPDWKDEKRPFTFTSLATDPYLEFTIKSYTDHDGVTNQIGQLTAGDELLLGDPWGTIEYQGEGYFIAGGAGITPFIAILRQLHTENRLGNNKLFFSNKTSADIIYADELKATLGDNAVFVITQNPPEEPHQKAYIDENFLKNHVDDFKRPFYICGPDPMIQVLTDIVTRNGADPQSVVFEK